MGYVTFDYECIDDRILEIDGNFDGMYINFKAKNADGRIIKKSSITVYDRKMIEEYISENAGEIDVLADIDYYNEGY